MFRFSCTFSTYSTSDLLWSVFEGAQARGTSVYPVCVNSEGHHLILVCRLYRRYLRVVSETCPNNDLRPVYPCVTHRIWLQDLNVFLRPQVLSDVKSVDLGKNGPLPLLGVS